MPSGLHKGSRIFPSVTFDSLLDVTKTSFFSLRFAFEATKHTPMLHPCSPWRNCISACARRLSLQCAASRQLRQSLPRLSLRLKSLVRGRPYCEHLDRLWVTASHLEVWRLLLFMVYRCAAWCRVTDVCQVGVCNSADVHYISFIQIDVTLFIDRKMYFVFLHDTFTSQ